MHNLVVRTNDLTISEEQKNNWEINVLRRGKGLGPLLLHRLTTTNIIYSNLVCTLSFSLYLAVHLIFLELYVTNSLGFTTVQKIPKKITSALAFDPVGTVVLCGNAVEEFHGEYSTSDDGRMVVSMNAWNNFVTNENLQVGQVVMFLFDGATVRSVKISVDKI